MVDSHLWKLANKILRGKAKGAKLMVLGVLLIGGGSTIQASTGNYCGGILVALGILAFGNGLRLYVREAESELERERHHNSRKWQEAL